jgi:O-antigen/teichoic acid export membrane protein
LFAIGWTTLRLFSIVGHLGLDSGIVKFGGQYWQKDALKLRGVALISLSCAFLSGLLFGIALYIAAPLLANEFFKKPDLAFIFRGFAFTFPFATTLRVTAAASSLSGKMLYGAIAEDIAQPAIQIFLFLLLFNMGMGLNSALLSTWLSYGISVILGLVFVARTIPNMLPLARTFVYDFIPLFKFSLPAIIGVTLGAFNLWGDRLLVGYFGSESDAGIYQSISIITMFTTIILSGIKITIAPLISQMFHDNNHSGIKLLAKSITRWSLYLSLPFLMVIFIAPNDMIVTIFGREYQSGALPLLLLTIGQIFYIIFGATDQFFLMTGRQAAWLKISSIIFLLTIGLDALMIPKKGLIGAAIVSSAMMFLLGTISASMLRNYLGIWFFDFYHVKVLFVAAMAAITTYFVTNGFGLSPAHNIALAFVLSITLFGVFLLIAGIDPGDKNILINLLIKKDSSKQD